MSQASLKLDQLSLFGMLSAVLSVSCRYQNCMNESEKEVSQITALASEFGRGRVKVKSQHIHLHKVL